MTNNVEKKKRKKPVKRNERGLLMRQELFVQDYCETFNATRSYMKVYGTSSEEVAATQGSLMLRNPKVQDRIEELRKFTTGKHNITRERIAKQYARLAFGEVRNLFNSDGELKPLHELTEDQAAIIRGFEVEENKMGNFVIGKVRKVTTADQKGALDSLAKMFGFNEPDKLKSEVNNIFPGGALVIQVVQGGSNKEEL